MKKFFIFIFIFLNFINKCFCNNYNINNIKFNIEYFNNKNNNYYYKLLKNNLNKNFDIINIRKFLYNIGHFNKINIYKLNNKLLLNLKQKPFISKIYLIGNNVLNKKKILYFLNKFNIGKNKFIDNFLILKFKKYIIDKYIKLNRYNINIILKKIKLNKNKYLLKIVINEGIYYKIRNLFIIGNNNFKKNKIMNFFKKYYKFNFLNLFFYDKFKLDIFINNLKNIKNFYINNGYFDFFIKDIYIKKYKNILDIFININEGNIYKLYDIKINSNINKYNYIFNKIKKKYFIKNKYFNYKIIKNIIYNIKKIFYNKGYINLIINFNINKINKNKIILYFNIKFNKRFYIKDIIFYGNNYFNKSFLIKKIPQKKNNFYNEYLINLGKLNLKKTGFFNYIKIKKEFLKSNSNKLNLIYFLKENNSGNLNFGIGYDQKKNLNYNISWYKNNFIYFGSKLLIKLSKNRFYQNSKIFYKYLLNNYNNIILKNKLFYKKFLYNNNVFFNLNYGFENNIIFYIYDYLKYKLGIKYINYNLYNIKSQLYMLKYFYSMNKRFNLKSKYNKIITNDFFLINNIILNKLNNNIFPNKGYCINIFNKITFPFSDNYFYKINFNFKNYYSIDKNNKWIFFINNSISYRNGIFNKKLPLYEKININENNFLRGFNTDNIKQNKIFLNSKSYKCKNKRKVCYIYNYFEGNLFLTNNLELIIPNIFLDKIYSKYIRTSLFLDSGIILNNNDNIKNIFNKKNINNNYKNIFRLSIGLSFKIITPLGPISLSYGFPLKFNNNNEINYIQFNMNNFS